MFYKSPCWPVGALALGLALGACSPPPTPAHTATAHTATAQEPPVTSAPQPASALSAEDIGRRIIRLVLSLHTLEDIRPANIERLTGIKVDIDESDPDNYGFGSMFADHWAYNLVSVSDRLGEKPRRLDFFIDDRSPNGDADMSPLHGLSFQDYRDALVAGGYSVQRLYGGRKNDPWEFTRGNVVVSITMQRFADPEKGPAYVRVLRIRVLGD